MTDAEPLGQWVLASEHVSRALIVLRVDSELDASTGLLRGTAELGCQDEAEAAEAESLVGKEGQIYLKSHDGAVHLVTFDELLAAWTKRFPAGSWIAKGDGTTFAEGRPLDRLLIRTFSWHERERTVEIIGGPKR